MEKITGVATPSTAWIFSFLIPAKKLNSFFDLVKVNTGIDTGPIRPFICYPDDRKRIGVYQPAGEVPFAGNSHDSFRPDFLNDLSRNGAAGGHKKFKLIVFRKFDKVLYFASAAPFAVVNIMCKSYGALGHLDTMGQKQEYLFCLRPFSHDKPVVQMYHRPLEALFFIF